MGKRISGLVAFILSAASLHWKDLIWEFFRSWGYERVHHSLDRFIDDLSLQKIVEYGPPIALAFAGLVLFSLSRPKQDGKRKRPKSDAGPKEELLCPTAPEVPKIALTDAVRRAYSETQDSAYADMSERDFGSDITKEDIFLYYANDMVRRAQIWGLREPSDTTKPQNLRGYDLQWINNGIVAKERDGNRIISNLMVSQKDLQSFIDHVRNVSSGSDESNKMDRQKGAASTETSSLPAWFELEQRFRELEPALQFTRIDGQTGAAGEFWRIAGGAAGEAEARFTAIASMASARLALDFPDELKKHKQIAIEPDPLIRWYKALNYIGHRYKQSNFVAREVNNDGSKGGFIFTGSIDYPAAASATLCLTLGSRVAARQSR